MICNEIRQVKGGGGGACCSIEKIPSECAAAPCFGNATFCMVCPMPVGTPSRKNWALCGSLKLPTSTTDGALLLLYGGDGGVHIAFEDCTC